MSSSMSLTGSSPRRDMEIEVVERLFEEFEWGAKPVISVFNKADLAGFQAPPPQKGRLQAQVSAKTGAGVPHLLRLMKKSLEEAPRSPALMFFPEGSEAQREKFRAEILQKKQAEEAPPREGSFFKAFLTARQRKIWRDYIVREAGIA